MFEFCFADIHYVGPLIHRFEIEKITYAWNIITWNVYKLCFLWIPQHSYSTSLMNSVLRSRKIFIFHNGPPLVNACFWTNFNDWTFTDLGSNDLMRKICIIMARHHVDKVVELFTTSTATCTAFCIIVAEHHCAYPLKGDVLGSNPT